MKKVLGILAAFLLCVSPITHTEVANAGDLGCRPTIPLQPESLENLSGCDFTGLQVANLDFQGRDLRNANFSGTYLEFTSFKGANLAGANFSRATLEKTNFSGANLTGANFSGARGSRGITTPLFAQFVGATLRNANFSGVDLRFVLLEDVKGGFIIGKPKLPNRWLNSNGLLLGPGAKLTRLDLRGRDLSNANLTGANLSGSNLAGSNLSGANLTGANLSGAILAGAKLDLKTIGKSLVGLPNSLPKGWKILKGKLVKK